MDEELRLWDGTRTQDSTNKQPILAFLEEWGMHISTQLTKESVEEKVFAPGILDPQ